MNSPEIVLALIFLAVAILYSSVGHACASGYLAAMALLGFINRALGALMGTQLGIKLLPARDLRYALDIVLLITAGKLLFT